jgi:hypothetical protein
VDKGSGQAQKAVEGFEYYGACLDQELYFLLWYNLFAIKTDRKKGRKYREDEMAKIRAELNTRGLPHKNMQEIQN